MLMGLTRPLKQGDVITLTLTFEHEGAVQVEAPVDNARKPGEAAPVKRKPGRPAKVKPAAAPAPAKPAAKAAPAKAAPAKAAPAKAAKPVAGKKRRGVTQDELDTVLAFISKNPGKRSEHIRNTLGIPQEQNSKILAKLRELKKVKTKGAKRATSYSAA